jgi:hypothetical protein
MKDFRILPEVTDDVAEAADWYDKEGFAGLGDRFLETFYASIAHLQKTGEIHRCVYSDFRRVFLKPFSYALYYRYHGKLLIIALVIHVARDPERIRMLLRARRK